MKRVQQAHAIQKESKWKSPWFARNNYLSRTDVIWSSNLGSKLNLFPTSTSCTYTSEASCKVGHEHGVRSTGTNISRISARRILCPVVDGIFPGVILPIVTKYLRPRPTKLHVLENLWCLLRAIVKNCIEFEEGLWYAFTRQNEHSAAQLEMYVVGGVRWNKLRTIMWWWGQYGTNFCGLRNRLNHKFDEWPASWIVK